jgi:SPP1 gp7 family putative phage head morphogenesis protein
MNLSALIGLAKEVMQKNNIHLEDEPDFISMAVDQVLNSADSDISRDLAGHIASAYQPGKRPHDIIRELPSGYLLSNDELYDAISTSLAKIDSVMGILQWSSSGLVHSKEWYSAKDDKVCEQCASLHTTIVELEEVFVDMISYPPLHVGCRCSLLPVTVPRS